MTNIKPWKEPFMIQTKENCCKNCFSLVRELVTPGINTTVKTYDYVVHELQNYFFY